MAQQSRLPEILAVTATIHVLLALAIQEGGRWARNHQPPPPPEVIELDTTPPAPRTTPPKKPPPEPPKPPPTPPPTPAVKPPPTPPVRHRAVQHVQAQPPRPETPEPPVPPPPGPPPAPGGGDGEVFHLPDQTVPGDIPIPSGHGHGHGGTGTGQGGGQGAGTGSGTAPPAPVSIAAIKTAAKPKGDYSYFGAGKDYPAEARRLGIEGVIRVRLLVDKTGKVSTRRLLNKLGHGLDELALARAATIEFEPARDEQDRPVASVVVWTFHFTLPK